MFSGYSDVAAYYVDPELDTVDGEDNEVVYLPGEYLPVYTPPDPWHRNAACQQDFIVISEFSEQEGPKPLITIPSESGGEFDLNEFAVRIMSVDFHTIASESFYMPEDTQVIISENNQGIYAYVHHFILQDSQARGFVRPLCMAYVTPDHSKLMSFYEEMTCEFTKVSYYFKYGNLMLFVRDMTHYLSDLQYTRERYFERQNENGTKFQLLDVQALSNYVDTDEDAILKSVNIQGLQNSIYEVKTILETTSSLLTDEKLEEKFRRLEEKCKSEENGADQKRFKHSCSMPDPLPGTTSANSATTNRRRSYSELADTEYLGTEQSEYYKPKVVRSSKKRFEKALRGLHELCQWGAKEGINRLNRIHKFFSRDLATLQLERKDSVLTDPASSLLTIGTNVQINFLQGLSINEAAGCFSSSPKRGAHVIHPSTSCTFVRRCQSDDSIASFQSAESFLSCQDDQGTLSAVSAVADSDLVSLPSRSGMDDLMSKSSAGGYEVISICTEDSSSVRARLPPNSVDDNRSISSQLMTLETLSLSSNYSGSGDCVCSPDKATDQSKEPPNIEVFSCADHVKNFSINSPGYGIQKFMQQYPFSSHIVFALLSGRTFIVISSVKAEKQVKSVIGALSLLVPGHSSLAEAVIPWQTKPMKITDLARVKLIGLGRPDKKHIDYMLPSTVKKYVSVLDLEKKTLRSPQYEGGLVTDIYNKRKTFHEEVAYVAYIHGVLLELGMKAYIYYHGFCLSSKGLPSESHRSCSIANRIDFKKKMLEFFTKIKVNKQDSLIIQYLASLIQQQQLKEYTLRQFGPDDCPAPSVSLNLEKCHLFKLM